MSNHRHSRPSALAFGSVNSLNISQPLVGVGTAGSIGDVSIPASLGAPVIAYVDVLDGPASGGENNDGCYLNISGINYGSVIGNVSVTVNGTEVAQKIYLGPSLGRPDIQTIGVQIANGTTTGSIVVTVGGQSSNTNFTFTVRSGAIYYCSGASPAGGYVSGNDATGVVGDITHPYKHPKYLMQNEIVSPGDHIVMLPGTYNMYTELLSGESDTMHWNDTFSGTSTTNMSVFMGYPGNSVLFNQTHSVNILSNYEQMSYMVCSNFNCQRQDSDGSHNSGEFIAIGQSLTTNDICLDVDFTDPSLGTIHHVRVVGIATDGQNLYGSTSSQPGWIEIGHGEYIEIYGCSQFDTAQDSSHSGDSTHGIYLGAFMRHVKCHYNYLKNIPWGRGILEISSDAWNCGSTISKCYQDVHCHGNLFDDCGPQCVVMDGPLYDIWLTSNIFRNCTTISSDIIAIRQDTTNTPALLEFYFHNNTIEGVPTSGLVCLNGPTSGRAGVKNEFINNLWYVTGGGPWPIDSNNEGYWHFETGTNYAPITEANNCFYGVTGEAYPFFGGSGYGDMNVDPDVDSNRIPNSTSPLLGAGSSTGLTKTNLDAYGRVRDPNNPSIGAFEYSNAV